MIEALSQGLAGHGRKDAPRHWGGNVFLQVLDPQFFAGRDAFSEQMDYLSDRSRNNKPIDPKRPVRVPGDQAARSIAAAQLEGLSYDALAWRSIGKAAAELGVPLPEGGAADR